MADRVFNELKTQGSNYVALAFSFSPQGTGAPALGEGCAAYVTSIVRNSAGNFTITLANKFAALVSAPVMLSMSTATDLKPQWGAIDVVSAKTLVLNLLAVATPTDMAANAANKVFVTLFLRNTSVTP
jgi:hypothetical protein